MAIVYFELDSEKILTETKMNGSHSFIRIPFLVLKTRSHQDKQKIKSARWKNQ